MVLGGGCSVGSEAIAGTAHHWNLINVSKIASLFKMAPLFVFCSFVLNKQRDHPEPAGVTFLYSIGFYAPFYFNFDYDWSIA